MSKIIKTDIEARIEHAVDTAINSFWEVMVEEFPEVTSGDFDPMYEGIMYRQATEWLEHWLSLNGKELYV